MDLIFNNGKPMFSPDLKNLKKHPFTETDRMAVLAEIDLMNTSDQWHSNGNQLGDNYKQLATLYSSVYDDKIAMSNLLLTFQGAIVSLEVDRLKYVKSKGENEKTDQARQRNQMMMRVHKEFSELVERNQQIMIMIKNFFDVNAELKKENRVLKEQLKKIADAENF